MVVLKIPTGGRLIMAGAGTTLRKGQGRRDGDQAATLVEPAWVRFLITATALTFLILFLGVPLLAVFYGAFREGWRVYMDAFQEPEAYNAIKLTLLVTAVAVPANTIFGVAAAWALTKFKFPGRQILITLIDLPFAVSPVIAGLIYVLIFSIHGWLPPTTLAHATSWAVPFFQSWAPTFALWLAEPKIIIAIPGLILATIFVTFPFVARELIPLMQSQGEEEELAAITLGATGWQTFWRVTLPNIKWGLIHGIILCNARAMGEFGAVSVVSGHIPNQTNTLPLHIELLFGSRMFAASFAMASVLTMLAVVTLILKALIEYFHSKGGEEAES